MSIKKVTFGRINLISIKIETYDETLIDSFDASHVIHMYMGRPHRPEKAREIAQAYMCGNQIPETVETS